MARGMAKAAMFFLSGTLACGAARAAEDPNRAAKLAAAQERQAKVAAEAPAVTAWRTDPACQMVFFAVLEGLYTDGVPDEAVDLIVPPAAAGEDGVKHSFVFRCPLCHAAYEAFVAYQHRTAFGGSGEAKSTLGTSFDPKILEGLKGKDVRTRVFAMGAMMRPWIERRMTMMNLGAKEQEALLKTLLEHAGKGSELFRIYRADPKSVYSEWMFYGGCQACEAASEVAKKMPRK